MWSGESFNHNRHSRHCASLWVEPFKRDRDNVGSALWCSRNEFKWQTNVQNGYKHIFRKQISTSIAVKFAGNLPTTFKIVCSVHGLHFKIDSLSHFEVWSLNISRIFQDESAHSKKIILVIERSFTGEISPNR